ncbi:MAG: LysM peptidoglycan-binding domain-containing protein [Methylococcaceae bacterium]|nr:LysM peptidoglycan-binding domain-containing protein [Methylococcaceae bacterium]
MSYTIKSGDTLGAVAQRYNVTMTQILAVNPNISNANSIRVGQVVEIPTGNSPISEGSIVYTIKSGDSLDKIARNHDVTVTKILKANTNIKNANRISVGQKIVIPTNSFFSQLTDFLTLKWVYEPTNLNVEINPYEPATNGGIDVEEIVDEEGTLVEDTVQITSEHQFNRKKFFAAYRDTFGSLNQSQVNGLGSLLLSFEQDEDITYIKYMAYMLATIKHETANKFLPITEYGGRSYFNKYDPVLANTASRRSRAKRNGNTVKGDGYKYRGRGFVQITWKNNYKKLGGALGYDLVNNPEKALEPVIAYKIMSHGMRHGTFTGRRLSSYISKDRADYRNARKIINGLDKANLVKTYAEKFERILRKSAT